MKRQDKAGQQENTDLKKKNLKRGGQKSKETRADADIMSRNRNMLMKDMRGNERGRQKGEKKTERQGEEADKGWSIRHTKLIEERRGRKAEQL